MAREAVLPFIDQENVVLTSEGIWLSNGHPITHQETIAAFFRGLIYENSKWVVYIEKEQKEVQVEDTPQFVVGVEFPVELSGKNPVCVLTNGQQVPLDPNNLVLNGARLVQKVGNFEVKFLRNPYYQVLDYLQKTNPKLIDSWM